MVKQFFSITLLAIIVSSCTAMTPYSFGFSAEEDDRFWISKALYNDYMGAPAGSIGCCLSEGGATAYVFPEEYPHKGYFMWRDFKEKKNYHAHVQYPDNVEELADGLADKVVLRSGKIKEKRVKIITSITEDNWVITWVANYIGGPGIVERELIEIGRAKGEILPPLEEESE